jgi:hypothetical protein
MKQLLIFTLLATVLWSCGQTPLVLNNNLNVPRTDEVIIISREDLSNRVKIINKMLPIFTEGDNIIPSQVDDINGDGNWDEVVLLLNFAANESKKINVGFIGKEKYPEFEKRTNLRLGIHQEDGTYMEVDNYFALNHKEEFKIIAQGEGVNWENDKIAFRNYFDCRNIKDLFAKRKPGLIIDKIHTPEMGSYHNLADWGMDVLHCGSSLGSGGLALLRNDSLFRLGSTDVYEYQKIVEGSLRSVFDLKYKGWNVDGQMMEATERISIYPGKYWFKSDVTFKGCRKNDQIVTGIVTSHLKNEPFEYLASDYKCIGTHGIQSLNNDELGMAILVPAKEAGKIGRTTNTNFFELGFNTVEAKKFSNIISETYYIGQVCKDNVAAKHYFFAGWALDKEQWKTEEGFNDYIKKEASKLSSSITIQ